MIHLIIDTLGLWLIFFILWWFFFMTPRTKKITGANSIDIYVQEGIYHPAQIKISPRKAVILRFIRKDPTPCSEYVVFPKLNLSCRLPLNKPTEITLPPQPPGEIEFMCQMGMYRGRVIVEG